MSRRTLFVTDLDGTLLGADSRVSATSARIISDLSRRGALITVATARTPGTVRPLLADTLITAPAVVMTGAAIWNPVTGSYSDTRLLSDEKAHAVCQTFAAHGISPMVYELTPQGILVMHCNPALQCPAASRFISERSKLLLKRVSACTDPASGISGQGRTILILAAAPTAVALKALPDIEAIPGLAVAHYNDPFYPGAEFIEVFTSGIDKARGVLRLKELTGANSLTVFGDSLNDIPMMRVADVAVAVENALPAVKQAAHTVIGPNTADSVAQYILHQYS